MEECCLSHGFYLSMENRVAFHKNVLLCSCALALQLFFNKFINIHFLHFSVLISSGVSIDSYNLNKQTFFSPQ